MLKKKKNFKALGNKVQLGKIRFLLNTVEAVLVGGVVAHPVVVVAGSLRCPGRPSPHYWVEKKRGKIPIKDRNRVKKKKFPCVRIFGSLDFFFFFDKTMKIYVPKLLHGRSKTSLILF